MHGTLLMLNVGAPSPRRASAPGAPHTRAAKLLGSSKSVLQTGPTPLLAPARSAAVGPAAARGAGVSGTARPRRRAVPRVCQPAASATATAVAVSEEWVHATGVPLLKSMSKCASLPEAAVMGVQAMALTAVGSLLLGTLLRFLDAKIHQSKATGSTDGGASFISRATWRRTAWVLLSSLMHQAQRLLPLWSAAYVATAASALLQVALERSPAALERLVRGDVAAASAVLAGVRGLTQFLQDAAEEVVVLLVAFTLLEFKNRAVAQVQGWLMSSQDRTQDDAVGLVSAAGAVASVAIWGVAGLVTLANYGVNLRPLLASLGASSLVVGLAAQSMLRNVAAGITLYATRPFSLGDHVVLWSVGGMVVVEGRVAALHPTRTVIVRELPPANGSTNGNGNGNGSGSGAHGAPQTSALFINNGDIVESMIVENKSRLIPTPLGATVTSAEMRALDSVAKE